jgi:hypothetical protein
MTLPFGKKGVNLFCGNWVNENFAFKVSGFNINLAMKQN